MKKNAIFICGPTAVGKTAVAVELARWLSTEIISFDSRQFFKELKIGASPPSADELAAVHHHLVGHLSVAQSFTAGDFEKEALRVLENLFRENYSVILVGGSGLYMQALGKGFDDMPEIPGDIRQQLNTELESKGLEPLTEELRNSDPEYYHRVDLQNPQRVIRALEVTRSTGKAYSSFRKGGSAKRDFNIIKIGLELPRPLLYERINERVDLMVAQGLEQEVLSLKEFRETNAMQTVGYREFFRYFDGELTREEAIREIKKNSRRYAKRQLTWFKRDEDIRWFEPRQIEEMKEYIQKIS